MANNRLYLKCPFCGKKICIGKSMGMCFYTPPYGDSKMSDVLDNFFEEHWLCYHDAEPTVDTIPFGGIFALEDEEHTYDERN